MGYAHNILPRHTYTPYCLDSLLTAPLPPTYVPSVSTLYLPLSSPLFLSSSMSAATELVVTSNWAPDSTSCVLSECSIVVNDGAAAVPPAPWPPFARLRPPPEGGPCELVVALAGPEDVLIHARPLAQLRVATSARVVEVWVIASAPDRQRSFAEMAAAGLRGEYISTISLRDAAPAGAGASGVALGEGEGEGGAEPPSLRSSVCD